MRAWRRREALARAVFVLSALLGLGHGAAADPESVHIDYGAPSSCPDAAAFMRSLRARTTRFRMATAEEHGRRFLVHVSVAGSAFAGRLEVRGPDGRTAVRGVDGPLCDEVADALALMTALAIDPSALTTVPKAGGESPGDPPPSRLPSVASADVAPASSPDASSPWPWSAGGVGHMTSSGALRLGYGGQLFVEAEAPGSSRLGPALRFGTFLNQANVELPAGAAARFQWALAMVEGCPVRLAAQRFAVYPCVSLRLGALRGEGRRISQPRQTVSFWADAGPVLRLRLAVTARLMLEVQGALLAPLYRPTFAITDMGTSTTAYSVPRIGGLAGMGLSYRFR